MGRRQCTDHRLHDALPITGCWVDSAFAVINGPSTFITINETHRQTKRPYEVKLELAPTWPLSVSSLDLVGSDSNHYRGPDYDSFIDSRARRVYGSLKD